MSGSEPQLILAGDSVLAQIAYEYFTHDSEYEVVGFTVEEAYLEEEELFDLPVVPFESVEQRFPPAEYDMFVAVAYRNLNRVRERLYREAKAKGYDLATYVSSDAFVWHNADIGENCFVFEDNTIQPWVTVEDDVILWSGNHVGHHSTIGAHTFVSSHVVISGFVEVGERSFLGVNSTIAHEQTIGEDSLIGAGATITDHTDPDTVVTPAESTTEEYRATEYFGVEE